MSDARFRTDGVWVITLAISYRDGMPPEGSELLGQARAAVLQGLLDAGIKGRTLGARNVRVFLDDGSGVVTEFDPAGAVGKIGKN